MMRLRKICKWLIIAVILVIAACGLTWAWNYYALPLWPDHREYKTIEERAEKALTFARNHNINDHYTLFVDYGIPSGTPRLFVWDHHQKKIISSTYVMHGPGGGSTDECPKFSNRPGSKCSTLGRFLVTKRHGVQNKRGFRIKGLDIDNKTAYGRGLMIHGSRWVDTHCWKRYIPLRAQSCSGCVTVSSRGMNYLHTFINNEKKPMLLWSFVSEQNKKSSVNCASFNKNV